MNRYIRIEEGLLRSTDFNSTEKIFLGLIFALTGKGTKGTSYSNQKIANMIGISYAHVSRLISKFTNEIEILNRYKEDGMNFIGMTDFARNHAVEKGYMIPKRGVKKEDKKESDNE